MILLILDKKLINFDKINYIYIKKNGIINLYRQKDVYSLMISIEGCKEDMEIYRTEDENKANQKLKYIISNLKNVQKIYLN